MKPQKVSVVFYLFSIAFGYSAGINAHGEWGPLWWILGVAIVFRVAWLIIRKVFSMTI